MADKGGGWVFAAVLIGAIALAGNGSRSSSSTSSTSTSSSSSTSSSGSSTQAEAFNFFSETKSGTSTGTSSSDACQHVTTFTSAQGKYKIPSDNSTDPVTARDCSLGPNKGEGKPVETLQRALMQCYLQPLKIDGDYGPATKESVRKLQQVLHIHVDGRYGPHTAGAMQWPTTADDGTTTCVAHPG